MCFCGGPQRGILFTRLVCIVTSVLMSKNSEKERS